MKRIVFFAAQKKRFGINWTHWHLYFKCRDCTLAYADPFPIDSPDAYLKEDFSLAIKVYTTRAHTELRGWERAHKLNSEVF